MSVAILGGMDRLKSYYVKQGRDLGFSNVKVFSRKFPDMVKRLKSYGGIVICTKNVAHTMVEGGQYGWHKLMEFLLPGHILTAYPR